MKDDNLTKNDNILKATRNEESDNISENDMEDSFPIFIVVLLRTSCGNSERKSTEKKKKAIILWAAKSIIGPGVGNERGNKAPVSLFMEGLDR